MAITQVTVTGTFQRQPGIASAGTLQWQLSADMFNSGQPVASRSPVSVTLDSSGSFSTALFANDDTGTSPSGTYWVLSGLIDGQSFLQTYVLSHTMAPTVDISQLTPAAASNPTFPVNAVELQGYGVASTAPSSGQVMAWDGTQWAPSGAFVASSSDANSNTKGAGTGVLAALTTGSLNTAVGDGALGANTSGIANTAFGAGALTSNTTGGGLDETSNSAFGAHALHNNTTGYSNTAMGGSALYSNTTGYDNTALGATSLEVCLDGAWNVAVGKNVMNYFVHPTGNTAVGWGALTGNTTQSLNTGNYNTCLGFSSLTALTSGSSNTAIGANTATSLTAGYNNVFAGFEAGTLGANVSGNATVSGTNNTFVGAFTGPGDNSDPSYATAIGRFTTCIGNGTVAIGCDSTGAGAAATVANQIVLGTANHHTTIPGIPAFVAGDKYLVVDANGNVHKSSLGPAS